MKPHPPTSPADAAARESMARQFEEYTKTNVAPPGIPAWLKKKVDAGIATLIRQGRAIYHGNGYVVVPEAKDRKGLLP